MFGFLPGPSLCCAKAATHYRAHFCGLCNCLRRDYGLWARWIINRDSTFLALLGSALAPQTPPLECVTCCNPWAMPRDLLGATPSLHYAAAATLCGLTAKLDDDTEDERGPRRWLARAGRHVLTESSAKALGLLHGMNFPVATVRKALQTQPASQPRGVPLREASQSTSHAYGEIVSHVAAVVSGPHSTVSALREIGRQLGFLIYAKDAWDDWAADRRRGSFNPLSTLGSLEERRAFLAPWLTQALTALRESFESLALQRYRSLLSVILVEGTERRVQEILNSSGDSQPPLRVPLEDTSQMPSRKPNKWRWCDCDCCDCCCHCPCGKTGGHGFCDCNPCDGDCCGCDCW